MPTISYTPHTPTLSFYGAVTGNTFNLVSKITTFTDIVNETGAPGLDGPAGVLDANRNKPAFAPIITALDNQSTEAGITNVAALQR